MLRLSVSQCVLEEHCVRQQQMLVVWQVELMILIGNFALVTEPTGCTNRLHQVWVVDTGGRLNPYTWCFMSYGDSRQQHMGIQLSYGLKLRLVCCSSCIYIKIKAKHVASGNGVPIYLAAVQSLASEWKSPQWLACSELASAWMQAKPACSSTVVGS